MNMLHAIASMISGLLGKSAFVDATHALVSEMANKKELAAYDAATAAAQALLAEGSTPQYTMTQIAADHDLSAEHAAVVTAAALATQNQATAVTPSA